MRLAQPLQGVQILGAGTDHIAYRQRHDAGMARQRPNRRVIDERGRPRRVGVRLAVEDDDVGLGGQHRFQRKASIVGDTLFGAEVATDCVITETLLRVTDDTRTAEQSKPSSAPRSTPLSLKGFRTPSSSGIRLLSGSKLASV